MLYPKNFDKSSIHRLDLLVSSDLPPAQRSFAGIVGKYLQLFYTRRIKKEGRLMNAREEAFQGGMVCGIVMLIAQSP